MFDPSSDTGLCWDRMGVICWISDTISLELCHMARERNGTTCHLWLTLKNQFLGNREIDTL